ALTSVDWRAYIGFARELLPPIYRALEWIDRYADHDGDGYVDYIGDPGGGLVKQGWKDYGNAIVNADGSMPDPPIALVEVQGYIYAAWREMARLMRRLDDIARASELD